MTDSLIKIAECVLKNNIFKRNKSVFQQLRRAAIGKKMVPPYATIFMDSLEEDTLSNSFLKPLVSWCYIDEPLWCGNMGKKSLKGF